MLSLSRSRAPTSACACLLEMSRTSRGAVSLVMTSLPRIRCKTPLTCGPLICPVPNKLCDTTCEHQRETRMTMPLRVSRVVDCLRADAEDAAAYLSCTKGSAREFGCSKVCMLRHGFKVNYREHAVILEYAQWASWFERVSALNYIGHDS